MKTIYFAAASLDGYIADNGGELAGQFFDHGLIDEMHVQTVAVFLNEGKKLFARKTGRAFKIKEIRQRGETCVEVIYLTK